MEKQLENFGNNLKLIKAPDTKIEGSEKLPEMKELYEELL